METIYTNLLSFNFIITLSNLKLYLIKIYELLKNNRFKYNKYSLIYFNLSIKYIALFVKIFDWIMKKFLVNIIIPLGKFWYDYFLVSLVFYIYIYIYYLFTNQ